VSTPVAADCAKADHVDQRQARLAHGARDDDLFLARLAERRRERTEGAEQSPTRSRRQHFGLLQTLAQDLARRLSRGAQTSVRGELDHQPRVVGESLEVVGYRFKRLVRAGQPRSFTASCPS
jgi:hypothetical protein